jgi:predicted sugar kinase
MGQFQTRGEEIRTLAKSLVLQFMNAIGECQPEKEGVKLAQIFKRCGFDWGDYPKATSSNQQYWVSAIVRELEAEGKVERVSESGPWRLKRP